MRCLKLEIHFLIQILFQVVKILNQVLKAGFIGKWTLRHKCAPGSLFRNRMNICEGSRTGQLEKLNCDAVTTKASVDPMGSSEVGMVFQNYIKLR